MVSRRSFALLGIGILLGLGIGTALPYTGVFFAGPPSVPEELVKERTELDKAVAVAEVDLKQSSLPPLAKALLAARLEIAKSSSALVKQRITAIRTWTKPEATQPVTQPDQERLAAVEREISNATTRMQQQEMENEKWAGGLVKSLVQAGVATSQLTLAMLETERIKAKYGIAWMPKIQPPQADGDNAAKAAQAGGPSQRARGAMVARVSNKRYAAADYERKIPEMVRFDIDWDTSGLPKPTRAVKGVLVASDLFGAQKLLIDFTVDSPLSPGQSFEQKTKGLTFNQFTDSHRWFKETDLTNMTIVFIAEEILYQDGEREKP